eukprot:PhM_4_TR8409/c0_g1_i3/m.59241
MCKKLCGLALFVIIVLCCAPSGTDASVASILARGERARRMADVAKAKRPHAVESASSHTSAPATAVLKFASPWWTFSLIVGDRTVAPYNQSGSGMTYFDDGRIYQPEFNGFTANLLYNYSHGWGGANNARHSATSFTVGDTWYPAVGGTVEYYKNTTGGTAAKITGIRIGAYATETWTVSVDERNFTWTVDREYTQDSTEVQCNRFNYLVWNAQEYVGSRPISSMSQIPSTTDNSFQWNNESFGFACRAGEVIPNLDVGVWSYTYTNETSTRFALSPADMTMMSYHDYGAANATFTWAWPNFPSTGEGDTTIALGFIVAHDDTTIRAGQKVSTAWTLQARPDLVTEAAPLQFTTDNTNFDEIVKKMARLFNMWEGNMFGNSPASVSCIHEMSFYTQISSVFNPVGGNQSEYAAVQRHLLKEFAEHAVAENGYVWARWNQFSYWNSSLTDQMPHFLLAYYHYAVSTGDKDFIVSVWGQLKKVVEFILVDMTMERDGVATNPNDATGLPYSEAAGNWFDIVNFGGKDAIVNAYAVTVLNAYAEMATWIGDDATATRLRALHTRAVETYDRLFWNESFGLYSDWIDRANERRSYFYVWQQALAMDPLSGIVTTEERRQRILNAFNEQYKRIRSTYPSAAKYLWCTPTNFISIEPYDSFGNGTLQNQKEYGSYENGACFMDFVGLELALRGYAGDIEGASELLQRTLDEFKQTRLWGQHYDWIEGYVKFDGSDVLTDTLMILYGLFRGMLRIQPTLLNGVIRHGPVASAGVLKGMNYTFMYLGKPYTVTV